MKAIRIKRINHALNSNRFIIVLLTNIAKLDLLFLTESNIGQIHIQLKNKEFFFLQQDCNFKEFENFEMSWKKFNVNDDYFFDLSGWR
jgi:hypothetical protein